MAITVLYLVCRFLIGERRLRFWWIKLRTFTIRSCLRRREKKGKMSGQTQRLNVVPTVTMLGVVKARLVGVTRGHALLKKKSDALTVQFRQILKKIVSTKESMGDIMKTSSFALTEAKYVAGDNIKHVVLENVKEASLRVRSRQENVAGVKLPKFDYTADGEATKNDLTGLARGGQQVQQCCAAYIKAIEVLVELASLQTSFLTLDEAIKTTNRRVNALENVVKLRLENTISYIKEERKVEICGDEEEDANAVAMAPQPQPSTTFVYLTWPNHNFGWIAMLLSVNPHPIIGSDNRTCLLWPYHCCDPVETTTAETSRSAIASPSPSASRVDLRFCSRITIHRSTVSRSHREAAVSRIGVRREAAASRVSVRRSAGFTSIHPPSPSSYR
ncbi:ATPase, V1 complex, subunit D [Sesbania bispinosa]|nr:ATPase, V1 complex, subunit D [Sesbania bispinosa]